MNNPMTTALVLAAGLILMGVATVYLQIRGLKVLALRKHVPSDEYSYLRNRYRRRFLTGAVLVLIGGLITGAYVSGMETRVDNLKPPPGDEAKADEKPQMTDDQKQVVRIWGWYWIMVLLLVFSLVGLALKDVWATRRYWLAQYRALREDHQNKLRRDLAVYMQHKEQTRGGRFGNRLGEENDDPSQN